MGRFEEIRTKVLKEFLTLNDDEIEVLSSKGLRTIKHLRNLKMSTINQWKYNKEISEGSYIVLRSYIMWEHTARPSPDDLEAMTPDEFMSIDDHKVSFDYRQDYQHLEQERPYENRSYDTRSTPRSFHDTKSSERRSEPIAESKTFKIPSLSETPSLSEEPSPSDSETESETPLPSEEPSPSKSETSSPSDEASLTEEPSPSEPETSQPSDSPSLAESETSSPSDLPSPSENTQDNNAQAQEDSSVTNTSVAADPIIPSPRKKLSLNARIEELEACVFDEDTARDGTMISRIKHMEEFIFDSHYTPPKNLTTRVNALVQEFELDF